MIYDSIIIGAGPAGISATIYAARKGIKFKVISENIGGQVTKTSIVENYTGYQEITGQELVKKFQNHLKEFNFDFTQSSVEKINKDNHFYTVATSSEIFQSKTIIIATGAKPKELNVSGEREFRGKGVTYCATCDAPLFHNKEVAVIGGGNSALESALQLTGIAKMVYILNINSKFSGDKILVNKLENNGKVIIFHNAITTEIKGEKFVKGINFFQDNKINDISVQGVFIEIGFVPNTKLVENLVKLNRKNEIEITASGQTSEKNIFAAGDCTNTPYKQIIIASGFGAIAALSAFNYLAKEK
ncbi:FAD-dependent oxidoreductase [Patescibacteria group bacterium]|nr:FAD-dependent oxidoreductase [Patescibacteria group bacterium]